MSNLTSLVTPVKKANYKVITIIASNTYIKLELLLNDGWEIVEVIIVDGVENYHPAETTFILYKA
jgi:hypothetical protein